MFLFRDAHKTYIGKSKRLICDKEGWTAQKKSEERLINKSLRRKLSVMGEKEGVVEAKKT